MQKSYTVLMTLELALIAIKYQGLDTNPFQQSSPSMLLFLTAIFCHAMASTAEMRFPTSIIFHVSGVIGCETLLWILLAEFWWWYIINVLLFLVASLCFNYNHIAQLLPHQMRNLEPQQAQAIHSIAFGVAAILKEDSCFSFMVQIIPLFCWYKSVACTASQRSMEL